MVVRRLALVVLVLFLMRGTGAGQEDLISKITIMGNAKVEDGVIRGAIKSREGNPFSADQVREDLRSIFNLGYFSDVQVDIKPTPRGKEVIFIVAERPSIKDIVVTGNQKVKLEDIKEKVTLKPRSILNLDKVKENADQIRKLYFTKGYYGVKVEEKVDYLEANEALVTYAITEGPKGRIKTIRFKGNKNLKASDLRKIMQTKEWTIFSFFTKGGILDEDVLKNDVQILTAYYYEHGYLEAKISEPKINLSDPKRITIEIDVQEGPQYRLGEIDFRGDLIRSKESLFRSLGLKRNDVYSGSAVRRDVTTLTEIYANQGYAYVEVNPNTSIDSKEHLANVVFDINKGKLVYFDKIQVTGNAKTRDKVVRRELLVAEGELYSVTALNESRNRLKRTGYFKEVDFTTSRGSGDDKIDLNLKVEEAPSGALTFGVGYSGLEGILGSASVSERNLFGLGYAASLRLRLGADSNDVRLGFTDPYFLGYRLSAGTDLYHEKVGFFDTYSYKVTGGDIRLGKEITNNFRLDLMYKLETVDVYDIQLGAPLTIIEQAGKNTTSALLLTPSLDTRNDFYAPSKGQRTSLLIENAGGPLGGDYSFVKSALQTSWYFPLPLGVVLNLRGQAGAIEAYNGSIVPTYEKFYVGGITTVRGFEYGFAGPVDLGGDPVGANYMLVFNTELIVPLAREIGLRGAVFFDMGKGANKVSDLLPLRYAAGVGIRWFSPFGPINIDFGWNLSPKRDEKGFVLDFGAGTVF